jgi:hypothetical protein
MSILKVCVISLIPKDFCFQFCKEKAGSSKREKSYELKKKLKLPNFTFPYILVTY